MHMSKHALWRWRQRFGGDYAYALRKSVHIGCIARADIRYYAPRRCIFVCDGQKVATVIRITEYSKHYYKALVQRYHYQVELSQLLDFLGLLKISL